MRFIIALISMIIFTWLAGFVLPWWNVALTSFIISVLIRQRPFPAFVCAFLAIFILWFGLAYSIDIHNDHILSEKMAMLVFKNNSSLLIIALSAFIGGITGGMGSLTGALLPLRKKIL